MLNLSPENLIADFPGKFRNSLRNDGFAIIEPDGKTFRSFSARNWTLASFLAQRGDIVFVALITARKPRRGSFNKLIKEIESSDLRVAVIAPLYPLCEILKRKGFVPTRKLIVDSIEYVWCR